MKTIQNTFYNLVRGPATCSLSRPPCSPRPSPPSPCLRSGPCPALPSFPSSASFPRRAPTPLLLQDLSSRKAQPGTGVRGVPCQLVRPTVAPVVHEGVTPILDEKGSHNSPSGAPWVGFPDSGAVRAFAREHGRPWTGRVAAIFKASSTAVSRIVSRPSDAKARWSAQGQCARSQPEHMVPAVRIDDVAAETAQQGRRS